MHPLKEKHKAEPLLLWIVSDLLVPHTSNFKRARHLVACLLQILKQVRVPLKSTGGNIDSPKRRGKSLISDCRKFSEQRFLDELIKNDQIVVSGGYLWISGLFLGFIISASAAFLWYMAKRSLRVMSEEWKC